MIVVIARSLKTKKSVEEKDVHDKGCLVGQPSSKS